MWLCNTIYIIVRLLDVRLAEIGSEKSEHVKPVGQCNSDVLDSIVQSKNRRVHES